MTRASCTIHLNQDQAPRYHCVHQGTRCILIIEELWVHPGTLSQFSVLPSNGEVWSIIDAGLLILRSTKSEPPLRLKGFLQSNVWHFWSETFSVPNQTTKKTNE